MHNEEIRRYITTDDYFEFVEWIHYMRVNNINHEAKGKIVNGKYKCRIEFIGYSKDEVEKIKSAIGFYYDE